MQAYAPMYADLRNWQEAERAEYRINTVMIYSSTPEATSVRRI